MILSNVKSLKKKMDELQATESHLLPCLLRRGFNAISRESLCELESFSLIHSQECNVGERRVGASVFLSMINSADNTHCVRLFATLTPNWCAELKLGLSSSVYVPPSGNAASAAAPITDCSPEITTPLRDA